MGIGLPPQHMYTCMHTHTHTLHTLHTYTHKTKEIMTSRLGLWVLGKITLTQTNQAGFTSSSFLVWLSLTIGRLTPGHLSMLASGQSESRKQGSKFTMECMWNPLSLRMQCLLGKKELYECYSSGCASVTDLGQFCATEIHTCAH